MKKIITIFCLVLMSTFLLPINNTDAHGEAGLTVTGTVDGYTGDIDYAYTTITVGVPGRFNFNLFSGDVVDIVGSRVEFDDLWVQIVQQQEEGKNGKTIFAGPVMKPYFGATGMTFTFFEAGEYKINVRYNLDNTRIVEIPYVISVYNPVVEEKFVFTRDIVVSFVIGFFTSTSMLFSYFLFRRLRRYFKKEKTDTD